MVKQFTPEDFGPITLSVGPHDDPSKGMCGMEMVSFLAGEPWSDTPACSSLAISHFVQVGNDRMDQETRDRLQLYVPKLIGTASPEHELKRAEYLAWQAIRTFAPIALDAVNLGMTAERMRNFQGSLNDAAVIADEAACVVDSIDITRRVAASAADTAYAVHATTRAAVNAGVADATTDVIYAARAAARTATYAVTAVANAASFNTKEGWDAYFAALDGVIAIGPHGESYKPEHMARMPALKKALVAA